MKEYIGKKCPYCNSVFTDNDTVVICSICEMPHHIECWNDNQGCTTFGCTGVIKEVLGKPIAERASAMQQNNTAHTYPIPNLKPMATPAKTTKRFEEIKRSDEQRLFPEAKMLLLGYTIIKDNNSNGDLFVRFQFRQYFSKILTAVLADVVCSDLWGDETERIDGVQFLDLHANSSTEFGQTVPIKLSNQNARNVTLTVRSLIYSDNTRVNMSDAGEALSAPMRLIDHFGDQELVAQYKRETTEIADVCPFQQKTLRNCCCGAVFDAGLSACPVCSTAFDPSVVLLDRDVLQKDLNAFQAEQAEKERIRREQEAEAQRRIKEAQRLAEERARKELEEKEKAEAEAQERKKKKVKRILTVIAATIAAIDLIIASVFVFIPLIRYTVAKSNLDKKNYDKAIATFVALGDFSDSAEMAKEAKYQKALSLMEGKHYTEAKALFEETKGYRESNKKATECATENTFLLALKDFENKEYKEAAKKFDSIKGSKNEAKEYATKSHYLYAKELFGQKKYKDAADEFSIAGSYEDAASMVKESQYLYGLECFEKKDYKTAYEYLTKVKSYKDVPERYDEVCYQYGLKLISDKSWENAIKTFSNLGDYSDSKTKLNDAKYGYVLAHKNRTDKTTYKYLKELKSIKYKDSSDIYSSLYKWSIEFIAVNTDPDDWTTKVKSVSRYCDYLHMQFKLTGGPPGETVTLSHRTYFPNGKVSYGTWYWENEYAGSTFGVQWENGLYSNPSNGVAGTLTIKIYVKGTGEYVGEASIRITA